MKMLTFKSTITSTDSVAAITLFLNAIELLDGFSVETDHPDHLLTVQTVDNRVSDEVHINSYAGMLPGGINIGSDACQHKSGEFASALTFTKKPRSTSANAAF